MSQNAMPFLIINLGCEMIYIIANRLSAQSVEVRKSQLILNDLTVNMFSEGFCTELFRPQPLYSLGATLSIFSSLSETSMMKLASNSIQKLFDLMRMSVKRQLQSLAHPLEIIEWTLNHVEGVQQFVPQQTQPTLIQLRERLLALHRTLNVGDYHCIRRALLNFTAGFRVKVSLFLNNRLQDTEGMFLYPPPSYLVPLPSCEAPGTVRRYSDGKVVETTTVPHRDASLRSPPHVAPGTWDCTQRKCRVTSAGVNVFAHGDDVLRMQSQEIVPGKAHVTAEEQAKEATRGYELEMNYLSQLAGKRHPSAHEKIHLTLFEEESNGTKPSPPPLTKLTAPVAATPSPPPAAVPATPTPPPQVPTVVTVDGEALRRENRKILGIANSLGDTKQQNALADNLLDLMDQM